MATQTAGKPNIVLITTDTQGREMISSYVDRPGVETPNIDRLARRGVLLTTAITWGRSASAPKARLCTITRLRCR